MARNTQLIWVKREAKYFCRWGWTQHRVICPAGKINPMISAKRNVILRCSPSSASLEGWCSAQCVRPSFEARKSSHLTMTAAPGQFDSFEKSG
jgi:hypothetical protein